MPARRMPASVTADKEAASQNILIRQACDVIARMDSELPMDRARLEEARRSLDLSEAAGSEAAEHLRLKLEDRQPCPVCGATEHPVTEVDRLLKDRVLADRSRVAELEAKVSASQAARIRGRDPDHRSKGCPSGDIEAEVGLRGRVTDGARQVAGCSGYSAELLRLRLE